MRAILNLLTLLVLCSTSLYSQNSEAALPNDSLSKEINRIKKDIAQLKNLKISGWVQAQFQIADTRGISNYEGGTFSANSDKRFMIRRGRVKFTYNGKHTQYVMQLNGTERGLNLTEIFATATDPWTKAFSITAGVMNRPFGFEIDQSSSVRESPERSRYTQILMPNERDLGAKIVIAPGDKSKLHGLRLDAGFYNGQGIYVPGTSTPAGYAAGTTPLLGVNEVDFQKDFIGRLSYYKGFKNDKIKIGIGVSHYNGGNTYQNNKVYDQITNDQDGLKVWKMADTTNKTFKNKTAPRMYYGAEAFFSIKTTLGTTTIRGEYITGTQSGQNNSSSSPFFLPSSKDTYIRNFNGMYAYFIHRIAKTKHEIAVKYEIYDPNTKVAGRDITSATVNGLSSADIKFTQLGLTYTYYMYENVKFMFNYNIVTNETTNLNGFTKDIRDNILTIRMQYKF
ncbi:hypothetical protein [Aurantibacillus circumpalustris]|uniref:hypothetical protein n=1 Tax=Aurantibacillus circumpalustris TaxID=3036359 RepID=UPI00295A81FE|nr:hypothetical protein [Aurantibacillus circumpalustris]